MRGTVPVDEERQGAPESVAAGNTNSQVSMLPSGRRRPPGTRLVATPAPLSLASTAFAVPARTHHACSDGPVRRAKSSPHGPLAPGSGLSARGTRLALTQQRVMGAPVLVAAALNRPQTAKGGKALTQRSQVGACVQ